MQRAVVEWTTKSGSWPRLDNDKSIWNIRLDYPSEADQRQAEEMSDLGVTNSAVSADTKNLFIASPRAGERRVMPKDSKTFAQ